MIQYDPIYANFNISERMLLELMDTAKDRRGRSITRRSPIFLSRENDKGFPFEGHFDYADLAVDQSTGTFMIRGIFPNPIAALFLDCLLPYACRLTPENAVLHS